MRPGLLPLFVSTIVLSATGCEPDADSVARPRPADDFLRDIVVVGDSWMAGVQSGGLTKRLQLDSVPALFAEAVGTSVDPNQAFTQPLIANPGYPVFDDLTTAGVYTLVSIDPPTRARIGWPDSTVIDDVRVMRAALELERDLPRSYRSFAYPGCFAVDVLNARHTGETWTAVNDGTGALFLETVLRPGEKGQLFGDSLTVVDQLRTRSPRLAFVGLGFDELFYGIRRGDGRPPYDAATFESHLETIVDELAAEAEGRVVVINRPRLDLLYQLDAWGLDAAARAALLAADDGYAAATERVAETAGAVLVDLRGWYDEVSRSGVRVAGIDLDLSMFGGITSLDGFTPTSTANALATNVIVETLNATYGTAIAPIDVVRFLDQSVITDVDVFIFEDDDESDG